MKIYLSLFLFICLISVLSYTIAEEISPKGPTPSVAPTIEGVPPPISRNPFIDAPYGRIEKSSAEVKNGNGANRANSIDNIVKGMKVKGVLLAEDYSMALLGHRIAKIGDTIHELKVTDITRKGVTLSHGERVIQLSLE